MIVPEEIRRELASAQQEARKVGDSPLNADRLAERVVAIARKVRAVEVGDETRNRLLAALADAERVLRRDDDGFEAARHLQAALTLVADRPKPVWPFD